VNNDDPFREKIVAALEEVKTLFHDRQLAAQQTDAKLDGLAKDIARLTQTVENEKVVIRLNMIEQRTDAMNAKIKELSDENAANFRWLVGTAATLAIGIIIAVVNYFLRK